MILKMIAYLYNIKYIDLLHSINSTIIYNSIMSEPYKIELVFISLDIDALIEIEDQIGDASDSFKFRYLNAELENMGQLGEYDVVVSPSNSFGELKGGIDYYYWKLLGGDKLQKHIYNKIQSEFNGEIAIGQTMVVDLINDLASDSENHTSLPRYLYMCPTMTIPMNVNETRNAYLFMKTLLKTLSVNNSVQKIKRVLVPVPCIGVGGMNTKIAAKQIKIAIQAFDGKGIIHAIFMTNENESTFRSQKIYEYHPNNVLQNARISYIQMTKR